MAVSLPTRPSVLQSVLPALRLIISPTLRRVLQFVLLALVPYNSSYSPQYPAILPTLHVLQFVLLGLVSCNSSY
jgi:hypothetical protein